MNIYLVFVIILFILAVSDLVVGISNDAVNFLNSSIGSKVAPLKVILSIAAIGVFVGATFSSGMMEIARSGIFHPGQFYFSEIMIIFLAVMVTDVILLDAFNTFGFPTSTTVSIVFELLGAAVAVSLIKISNSPDAAGDLNTYINSAKALAIISGILISVVIAFIFGTVIQFITRLIFSFNYERYMKYFGAVWGGVALTAIIYFMLVKGAKGASFMTPEALTWIGINTWKILLFSFLAFTALLQVLYVTFKINILKIIVLAGTFSLAMAFAGNDLVNFIGVPLAGFESFREFISNPSVSPDTLSMESLTEPVKTPTLFLLAAGLIMVITLFTSKKAHTVSRTEINLARQDEGTERFSSSALSRSVVHGAVSISRVISKIVPGSISGFIDKQFELKKEKKKRKQRKDESSFDLLRASVNMFVASILIATGTSLKLPLSTTYVTFMVAMGTSLADRAWGRESAVYRISGVLSVIGGWFFTALIAFTVSFLIALFLNWGGIIATLAALGIALAFVIRTNLIHKRILEKEKNEEEKDDQQLLSEQNILTKCNSSITGILSSVSKFYFSSILNLIKEDRRKMKKLVNNINELNSQAKDLKYNLHPTLIKLEEEHVDTGHYYVQILDYLREIAHCLKFIADPIYEHLDNNHPPLLRDQVKDLHTLNESISSFLDDILAVIKKQNYRKLDKLIEEQQEILDLHMKINKKHIKFIKSESVSTRNSLMYMNILNESKNLVLFALNLVKSHRDFLISNNK
ncbi:MAG: inorganic phosphate transporter [Bacteroidales bacterium]|nr:inorganic phosphate transporter [Bacteroidales bacterium]